MTELEAMIVRHVATGYNHVPGSSWAARRRKLGDIMAELVERGELKRHKEKGAWIYEVPA